jgi:hypothetical protein
MSGFIMPVYAYMVKFRVLWQPTPSIPGGTLPAVWEYILKPWDTASGPHKDSLRMPDIDK